MATISHHGQEVHTVGELPSVGTKAKDFALLDEQLQTATLETFAGQRKILNIFPSIDTSTCASSVKTFEVKIPDNTVVLNISRDTPFAQKRFCQSNSIGKGISLSDMSHTFGNDYALTIISGKLKDFLSRAVIVLDIDNTVLYTEQVAEITQEPEYEKAIEVLK